MEQLPHFEYHPDPLATGSIKTSDKICECCEKSRGYIYTASFYSTQRVKALCPWCIFDGSAAELYNGSFSNSFPLSCDGVSENIIATVTQRTPGFSSWQEEVWLSCCGDACEFRGDATKHTVSEMTLAEFQKAFDDDSVDESVFSELKMHYEPGGNPAIYHWVCRRCRKSKFYADFT